MRLVSPCQPSLMTVTSMLTMSPLLSARSFGMPWQTWWLIDVQIDFGYGRVARRRVVQRRRNGLLDVHDVVVREAVELVGRDAGAHVRGQHVQHLGGKASGDAHALDLLGRLDGDRHGDYGNGTAPRT